MTLRIPTALALGLAAGTLTLAGCGGDQTAGSIKPPTGYVRDDSKIGRPFGDPPPPPSATTKKATDKVLKKGDSLPADSNPRL